jgi:hypothetical protein
MFLQKEKKRKQEKNNKILPATLACYGTVVKNKCSDHFSLSKRY